MLPLRFCFDVRTISHDSATMPVPSSSTFSMPPALRWVDLLHRRRRLRRRSSTRSHTTHTSISAFDSAALESPIKPHHHHRQPPTASSSSPSAPSTPLPVPPQAEELPLSPLEDYAESFGSSAFSDVDFDDVDLDAACGTDMSADSARFSGMSELEDEVIPHEQSMFHVSKNVEQQWRMDALSHNDQNLATKVGALMDIRLLTDEFVQCRLKRAQQQQPAPTPE